MARKKLIQPNINDRYRCRDCAHSYDWHSRAMDGHLILCRCKYDEGSSNGRWCKFLEDKTCEHFQLRKDEEKE